MKRGIQLLDLHPSAKDSFDKKASSLVKELVYLDNNSKVSDSHAFNPDISTVEIRREDVIGEIKQTQQITDYEGNVLGIIFNDKNGRRVGIVKENYINLTKLTEQIYKVKGINVVSYKYIFETIIDWIISAYAEINIGTMTDYLISEGNKIITDNEIWIPINELYIQSEITIGRVQIRTITKQMIDEYLERLQISDEMFLKKIRRLQGLAAGVIKVKAEAQRANEIAFEEVGLAISIIRIFSNCNLSPKLMSYCDFFNNANIKTRVDLRVADEKIIGYSTSVERKQDPRMCLDNRAIAGIMEIGLADICAIISKEDKTDYEEAVLNSLLLYSKSSLMAEPSDKLVYMLSALESFLLRNGVEGIIESISNRLAFSIGNDLDERKKIVKNVKDTYSIRSKFIHHGQSISDLEVLRDFMRHIWIFFTTLPKLRDTYSSREDFINDLEERKLS
jgi:DNA polymerase III delta prime subunit